MSLSGTSGLVRVSQNPDCHLQAAMAIDRRNEVEFYRAVTGREYPREYGERVAARRRGAKFESNLNMNHAALLRQSLSVPFGYDPDQMTIRNLADEIPGPPDRMRALRLHRTRQILKDLSEDRSAPHIIIQPQFALPTGTGLPEFVSPDAVVLDPEMRIYVPCEQKSFVSREGNVVDPADLNRSRRQAGAQILALRADASIFGLQDRVKERAVFVFATAFGLVPAPAVIEYLHAPVYEVSRAIETYARVRAILLELRRNGDVALENLVDELAFFVQESCFQTCVLADHCAGRVHGSATTLGDDARDLLGADTRIERVIELLRGAQPADDHEHAITDNLRIGFDALGIDAVELERRLA